MNSKSKYQARQKFRYSVVSLIVIVCCVLVIYRPTDDKSRRNVAGGSFNKSWAVTTTGLKEVMSNLFVTLNHGMLSWQITTIHGAWWRKRELKCSTCFASNFVIHAIDAFFQNSIYKKKSSKIGKSRSSDYAQNHKRHHWVFGDRNKQLYQLSNQSLKLERHKLGWDLMICWNVDKIITSCSKICYYLFTSENNNTKRYITFAGQHSTVSTYSRYLSVRIDSNQFEYFIMKRASADMSLWNFGTDNQAEYPMFRTFPEVQPEIIDINKTAEGFRSEYDEGYSWSRTINLYKRILHMDFFRTPKLWYQGDENMLVLLDTSCPTVGRLNDQQNTSSILIFSADDLDVPISILIQCHSDCYDTYNVTEEATTLNQFSYRKYVVILSTEMSFETFNEHLSIDSFLHTLEIFHRDLSEINHANTYEHYNHNAEKRPKYVSKYMCFDRHSINISLKLKLRLAKEQCSGLGDTYGKRVKHKHNPDSETRQLRISNDTVTTGLTFLFGNNISRNSSETESRPEHTLSAGNLYYITHAKVDHLRHSNNKKRNEENVLPWGKCRKVSEDVMILVEENFFPDFIEINLKYFKPNHTTYTLYHGMKGMKQNLLFALTMVLVIITCHHELKTFGHLMVTGHRRHSNTSIEFLSQFPVDYRLQKLVCVNNMETKSTIFEKSATTFPSFPSFIFSPLRIPSVINYVYPVHRKTVNQLLSQCGGDLSDSAENPMCYELLRLETFSNFPLTCPIRPLVLAEAGFFYTNNSDEVHCFCCSVQYSGWGVGDWPRTLHARISPGCRFIRGVESGNVSIIRQVTQRGETPHESLETFTQTTGNTNAVSVPKDEKSGLGSDDTSLSPPEQRPRDGPQFGNISADHESLSRNFAEQLQLQEIENLRRNEMQSDSINRLRIPNTLPKETMPTSKSAQIKYESLGIMTDRPKYPAYSVVTSRISSYQGWPSHKQQTPKYMAIAGFFYAGYDDYTRCFYCGGGLKHWEVDDDPWVEHAKWFPLCSFVRQNKGDQFILLAQQSIKTTGDQDKLQFVKPENLLAKSDLFEVKLVIQTICEMGYSVQLVRQTIQELIRENIKVDTGNVLDRLFIKEEEDSAMNTSSSSRSQCGIIPNATSTLNSLDVQSLQGKEDSCSHEDQRVSRTHRHCRICKNKHAVVALLPCGHISCCLDCAPAMRKCPVCNETD